MTVIEVFSLIGSAFSIALAIFAIWLANCNNETSWREGR
jgi:hypothetical protein